MIVAFLAGVVFALIARWVGITRFDRIIGFGLLLDFTVAKILLVAIGTSALAFFVEYQLGAAVLEVKPLLIGGVVAGGVLFGVGMALLGYCPGTMPMALGEGSLDAGVGLAGGLTAGLLYTLVYPWVAPWIGPDLGAVNLYVQDPVACALIVAVFAAVLFAAAFWLDRRRPPAPERAAGVESAMK